MARGEQVGGEAAARRQTLVTLNFSFIWDPVSGW